jgi:uncharacterized membrane protein (DUF4010 family)
MNEELWRAIGIGALCGATVGIEREWSGQAKGAEAHFGGLRTFTLLGLLGGVSGWLWTHEASLAGALLVGAAGALVVAAYAAATRRDIDGTTEVAALVVIGAALVGGLGQYATASAIAAGTALLLAEKRRLHGLVDLVGDRGFLAGIRFAVMALVVLPLLPDSPVWWLGGVRLRQLWSLVLLFSGLSFAGYVARAWVGAREGLRLTGLLGGVISSTSVTLTFARLSREPDAAHTGLAGGAIAASTVLFPRVLIAAAVIAPGLVFDLARMFAMPFAAGVAAVFLLWRAPEPEATLPAADNPLQVRAALQMAALFQVVWIIVTFARSRFGDRGLIASSLALGLVDVDALTASLASQSRDMLEVALAASAIVIGITANTAMKVGISVAIGRGRFRAMTSTALLGIAAALLLSLAIWGSFTA